MSDRLRLTRSFDGTKRATLRVEHRVDIDDLIELLAWWWHDHMGDNPPDTIGERRALAAIKEKLRHEGASGHPYWHEDRDEHEVHQARAWARDVAMRLWGRGLTWSDL